jgi:ubiquinone/menaquinone biosynthesis C-methylase UbiE
MLHHIPSPGLQDAALAELARVLRPGGLAGFTQARVDVAGDRLRFAATTSR